MDAKTLTDTFRGNLVGLIGKEIQVHTNRMEMYDNRFQGEWLPGTLVDVGVDYIRVELEGEEGPKIERLFPFGGIAFIESVEHEPGCACNEGENHE